MLSLQALTSSLSIAVSGAVITFLPPCFPGHTPLHCAVLAHNALLREQGHPGVTKEQQEGLQHQSEELESCIQLLVQAGASIYSRVGNCFCLSLSHPCAVRLYEL